MELSPIPTNKTGSDDDKVNLLQPGPADGQDQCHTKCINSIQKFTEGGTVFDGFLLAGMMRKDFVLCIHTSCPIPSSCGVITLVALLPHPPHRQPRKKLVK